MITRHRNWAIIFFVIALALLGVFLYLWRDPSLNPSLSSIRRSYRDWKQVVWIFSGVASAGFVIWGSAELAYAKGYRNGEASVLILLGIFCCPIVIYALPFIVIFALKDRTRDGSRHRR